MASGKARVVRFSLSPQQPHAVHVRLTPQLLEALLHGQRSCEAATLRFGDGKQDNAITVGDTSFQFTHAEAQGDLLRAPASGGAGELAGAVRSKLLVSRGFQAESQRMRERAQQAERGRRERTALPLPAAGGQPGKPAVGAARPARTVAGKPPAAGRGLTPPPPVVTQAMLAPPQRRLAAPASQLDLASAADKPMRKSASAPRLAAGGAAGAAGSVDQTVIEAARLKGLRMTLIALLARRQLSLQGIRAALAEVARAVPGFAPPAARDALERAVKAVAFFQAPGKYVLHEGLRQELPAAPPPEPAAEPSGSGGSGEPPLAGRRVSGAKRPREPAESPPSPPLDAAASLADKLAETPPAASPASTAGAASLGTSGAGSGPRRLRRTASTSSRGSAGQDEAWVGEYASRQPEPPAQIHSKQEYLAAEAEFNRKYERYFRLHQLIEASKRDFEALQAAADEAPTPEQRRQHEADLQSLWERRRGRVQRWDEAFRTLHAELAAAKQALGAFVAAIKRQQAGSGAAEQPVGVV